MYVESIKDMILVEMKFEYTAMKADFCVIVQGLFCLDVLDD